METRRVLVTAALVLVAAAGTASAQQVRANGVKLSAKDQARLARTARRFDSEIRDKFTPVADLHITEANTQAGVRWTKTRDSYMVSGPTVFEVTGVGKAGGSLDLVLTGGASGHVMQSKYGGRPFSVVEGYGKNDTIYLTHVAPGASRSTQVLKIQSRGLVTQEAFSIKLGKGEHSFWYFRGGPNEASGGEGSEPELRQVKLIVK